MNRRAFLFGASAVLAAPALIKIDHLMKLAVLRQSMSREEMLALIAAQVELGISQLPLSLYNPTLASCRNGGMPRGWYDGYETINLAA